MADDMPIPAILLKRRIWVLWRHEERNGKPTKVPYQPNGKMARVNDPLTWTDYHTASKALERGGFAGLGVVLGYGLAGIDLDWKGYKGEGIPIEAQTIIDRFSSYAELSPSGKGAHILLMGRLPDGTRNRTRLAEGVELEVYDGARFFTFTGQRLNDYDITQQQAVLEALIADLGMLPKPAPQCGGAPAPQRVELDDDKLIKQMLSSKSGADIKRLWGGDWSGYPSQSEADMALASHLVWWTNGDTTRADALFRKSGLYRKKWDERHHSGGKTYGQATLERALSSLKDGYQPQHVAAASTKSWPEPDEIESLEPPSIPTFDALSLLPKPLGPWAADLAERMCAPVEFLATAALVAVAGVVGNRVLMAPDPEANPGWLEAPNLWGLLVGEPGTKKSPSMERAFAPLHSLEATLHKENQRRRDEWELDRKNRKKGDPVTEDDLHPPAEEALLTHDITPEKLADLLEHNPYGLAGYQDELLGLIATWERPEKAGERQFYLKLWNGLSPHTVRRIQRGSHYIPVCTLSLLGGAQPGPLARYILEAAKGWNNDGLLQRFQLLVRAELPEYLRVVKPTSSLDAEYAALFESLPDVLMALHNALPLVQIRKDVERPVLNFDKEAQSLYLQWLADTARESRQPTTSTLKRSLLEKQSGLVPKLALILELVDGLGSSRRIGVLSTARAIALANLYRAHTLSVWWGALQPELDGAAILAKRIRERVKTRSAFDYERITVRGILRANWRGLTNARAVEGAIAELEARGWLKRERDVWIPNPRIWE